MTRERPDVTEAELSVLKELWELGSATIRELTDRLYPGGDTAHYGTVQKLLERLQAKRCVRRKARGRVNVFTATVDRSTLIAHRLRETANQLCEGSLTPLLTQLVDASELSEADVTALRALVDSRSRSKGER